MKHVLERFSGASLDLLHSSRAVIKSSVALPRAGHLSPAHHHPFLMVVGSGRSGSTLLRRLLMERLSIYIPPETYVLPKIASFRVRARALSWVSLVDLVVASFEYHEEFETFNLASLRPFALEAKKWQKAEQTLPNLVRELYKYFSRLAGLESAWLGDKTPLNTLHLGKIAKILPGAVYVYLVRDPVDVCASYIEAGIYDDLATAARRWIDSQQVWERFKKSLHPDCYIEARYEDLVANPDALVESIALRFGVPPRSELVQVLDILGDATSRSHHANVLRAPTTASIGKGRRTLTPEQKAELRPLLNSAVKKGSYELL